MAERSIRAILRAEVGQYTAAMGEAARSTEAVGTAAEKSAQTVGRAQQTQTTQARSFSSRLAASARENEQAWTTVGGAIGGVGAAMGGVLAVVGTMGGQYNALRQTATQALTAITGSAEEAAAQMARMDEFGSTSWLMRDSIIRAQQTLTGFGIETSKVIGYMDSLAEATAAAGGTSQDFEELARIMGQVNSQGKITAETLNQFGIRGVDAAQMIADAMGTTAGSIREQITAGTLDAEVALDALSEGMMMNFEGASDLVRNTFSGAVADVTAAVRDIGAIMMAPLIDPTGGGFLTEAIAGVGDLLFSLRDLPPEVLQVGGALAGLGALAATAAGGFFLLAPRAVAVWDALGNLGRVGPAAQSALRGIAPYVGRLAMWGGAVGVTAVALGALASAITTPGVTRGAADLADSIREVADAGGTLADMRLDDVFESLGKFGDIGPFEGFDILRDQSITEVLDKLADPTLTQRISAAFGGWGAELEEVGAALDEALTFEVDAGNIEGVREVLQGLGYDAETLARLFPETTAALEETGQAAGQAAPPFEGLAESLAGVGEAMSEAAAGLADWGDALSTTVDDQQVFTGESIIQGMQETLAAVRDFRMNLETAYDQISNMRIEDRGGAMEYLSHMQEVLSEQEYAMFIAAWVDMSEEDRQIALGNFEQYTAELEIIANAPNVEDIFPESTFTTWFVDASPATTAVNDVQMLFNERAELVIDGNTIPVQSKVSEVLAMIGASEEDILINGDPIPADMTLGELMARIASSEEQVSIGGDNTLGVQALEALAWLILGTNEYVTVNADTNPATADVVAWMPPGKTVNVDANLSPAQQAINAWRPVVAARVSALFGSAMGGDVGAQARAVRGFATGGAVYGPGTGTSDSVPAISPIGTPWRLSNGEHVLTAAEVAAAGGHQAIYQLRGMMRTGELRAALSGAQGYAAGGPVPATTSPTINFATPATAGPRVSEEAIGRAVARHMSGARIRLTGTEHLVDGVAAVIELEGSTV